MHEVKEEEDNEELYTPAPGHRFGEVKEEEDSRDADLDSLYTPPPGYHHREVNEEEGSASDADLGSLFIPLPGRHTEEVKRETQDEAHSLYTPSASPTPLLPAASPHQQTNDYWPQQHGEFSVRSQPLQSHGVAPMIGQFVTVMTENDRLSSIVFPRKFILSTKILQVSKCGLQA